MRFGAACLACGSAAVTCPNALDYGNLSCPTLKNQRAKIKNQKYKS
jgi:hypothetical protein